MLSLHGYHRLFESRAQSFFSFVAEVFAFFIHQTIEYPMHILLYLFSSSDWTSDYHVPPQICFSSHSSFIFLTLPRRNTQLYQQTIRLIVFYPSPDVMHWVIARSSMGPRKHITHENNRPKTLQKHISRSAFTYSRCLSHFPFLFWEGPQQLLPLLVRVPSSSIVHFSLLNSSQQGNFLPETITGFVTLYLMFSTSNSNFFLSPSLSGRRYPLFPRSLLLTFSFNWIRC